MCNIHHYLHKKLKKQKNIYLGEILNRLLRIAHGLYGTESKAKQLNKKMKIYLGEIPNCLRRIAHGLYGAELQKKYTLAESLTACSFLHMDETALNSKRMKQRNENLPWRNP